MTDALSKSTRLADARAHLAAFTERLILENVAADYRRGRDPSANLKQLLELQALKHNLGIQRTKPE